MLEGPPPQEKLKEGDVVVLTEKARATSWGQKFKPDAAFRIYAVNQHDDAAQSASLVPADIPEEEIRESDLLPFSIALTHLTKPPRH